MGKVSILFNVLDRFELAQRCIEGALDRTGYADFEVLAVSHVKDTEFIVALV